MKNVCFVICLFVVGRLSVNGQSGLVSVVKEWELEPCTFALQVCLKVRVSFRAQVSERLFDGMAE